MCTSAPGIDGNSTYDGSSVSGWSTSADGVPEMVVTAPRVGLDMDVYQNVDWGEVGRLTAIGTAAGAYTGIGGAAVTGAAAAAGAVEAQEDIDLTDLVDVKDDMVVIPGVAVPYTPLY
ncbi:MAG: hypothetical protein ACODAC_09745 [Pseudomonadota bacterium]